MMLFSILLINTFVSWTSSATLSLTFWSLEKSSIFYDKILGIFDYKRHYTSDSVCSWISDDKNMPEFLIYASKLEQKDNIHNIYDPWIHHFCFKIDEKDLVNEVYEVAKNNGAEILDEPKNYPTYAKNVWSEDYYAVYFNDIDGIKLEFTYIK